MGKRIKKLKNVRLHREGTDTLVYGLTAFVAIALILWFYVDNKIPFWSFVVVFGVIYSIVVNFFRCPKRYFDGETEKVVVAPADGKVVVIEEVFEDEYFHDKRLMISIFMSLFNVHANWFPVDGYVTRVEHQNGNFHMAWLPKASLENEHSTVIIRTPRGQEIMVRQVAGALARRIVTYARPDEECYIDEHLGFIKFGSRVDLFLPLDAKVEVSLGQSATGNQTVIARLKAD